MSLCVSQCKCVCVGSGVKVNALPACLLPSNSLCMRPSSRLGRRLITGSSGVFGPVRFMIKCEIMLQKRQVLSSLLCFIFYCILSFPNHPSFLFFLPTLSLSQKTLLFFLPSPFAFLLSLPSLVCSFILSFLYLPPSLSFFLPASCLESVSVLLSFLPSLLSFCLFRQTGAQ